MKSRVTWRLSGATGRPPLRAATSAAEPASRARRVRREVARRRTAGSRDAVGGSSAITLRRPASPVSAPGVHGRAASPATPRVTPRAGTSPRRSRCRATATARCADRARGRPAAGARVPRRAVGARAARRRRARRASRGCRRPGRRCRSSRAPSRCPASAPRALGHLARRTRRETAPCAADHLGVDAEHGALHLVGVGDHPAEHVGRGSRPRREPRPEPARRCTTRPPPRSARPPTRARGHHLVHRARRRGCRARRPSASATRSSRASAAHASPGPQRTVTSSSAVARRRCPRVSAVPDVRVEVRHDLHDRATRGPRRGAARARAARPARASRAASGGLLERGLPHRLELPGRPGQHDDQRARRAPGGSPARCPAAGAPIAPPGRDACFSWHGPARRAGVARASPGCGAPRPCARAPGVEHQRPPGGPGHRLHGEVVVGRARARRWCRPGRPPPASSSPERRRSGRPGRRRRSRPASTSTPRASSERARMPGVALLDPAPQDLVAGDQDRRPHRRGTARSARRSWPPSA